MPRIPLHGVLLAAFAAWAIWHCPPSAADEAASDPAAARAEFSRGLLWRIEYPGAPASYLFGTLHVDDERVLELPAPVRQAFDTSRGVALEMLNDEDSIREFRAAMVTRDPLLPGQLGTEVYARVDNLLGEHGIPHDLRPRLKPWSALLVLLRPRETPGIILDNLLMLEAAGRQRSVHHLETIEEQISAFESMPLATQLALLRHALARYRIIQDAVRPMIHAYLDRDLGAIWRINGEAMGGDEPVQADNARFLEAVLFQRSERFAERLAPLLREGGLFAAVGALHLYGERGVPSRLRKLGFTLTLIY